MTHENKKQAILDKIREVCPELCYTSVCRVSRSNPSGVRKNYKKPHLENLLSAINISKNGNRLDDIGLSFNFQKNVLYFENKEYWLDKTVEQNLDNEALTDLIYELIV